MHWFLKESVNMRYESPKLLSTESMIRPKDLSDDELHRQTLFLSKKEQELTLIVLDYLAEVFRRRVFAIRGYSSLWDYCVKYLGYSEPCASLRIKALELLTAVE